MKKQTGFTLIEIMIAMILGLIVVGATISIYITTVGSSSSIIKSARLNHDLEAVMSLMINDIKRSGYWGGATSDADSRNNPFTQAATNIQIPSDTCILYSYDADGDGTVDSNEYYGYKLEDNSIKMRKTGTTTADCDDGEWEEFVDGDQLNISTLQFSFAPITGLTATSRCLNVTNSNAAADAPDPPSSPQVICAANSTSFPINSGDNLAENRLVNILIAGQLKSEGAVTKNLNATVEVRNNRLCVWNGTDCP